MLKPAELASKFRNGQAAAFGRLCVETSSYQWVYPYGLAAAFGRLCVETGKTAKVLINGEAAAFGRLCVETELATLTIYDCESSRLRAAVC